MLCGEFPQAFTHDRLKPNIRRGKNASILGVEIHLKSKRTF